MKKLIALGLLSLGIVFLAGCGQQQNSQTANQSATSAVVDTNGQTYTDAKTGISFFQPDGWIVSTNEGGNLYTYTQGPYQTVVFEVFTDKNVWEQRQYNPVNSSDNSLVPDILVDSGQESIGGYQALFETYERRDTLHNTVTLSYTRYFVDTGSSWYEIETSESTEAVQEIVKSTQFASVK
ncbi:MAG: hypothetical protein WC702_00185 [Patescibacteria group bacterium]|jgi:hypothetical protein